MQALILTRGAETLRTYADHATDSGATVERSFCPSCGSPVKAENKTKFPGAVILTYGTMELQSGQSWQPGLEYYCVRKAEWLGTLTESQKFDTL